MTASKKRKVDLTIPPPKPLLTVLLLLAMAPVLSNGYMDWISQHAFSAQRFADLLAKPDYLGLISMFGLSTLAQLSPWIWVCNAFFTWTFGSYLEQKLGPARFFALVLLSVVGSWMLIYLQASGVRVSKYYIGPSMLLFCLLGGYFAYLPKKPFRPADWVRPAWKIFREDSVPQAFERYWVSPWLFIITFAVFQIALQASLSFTRQDIVEVTSMPFLGQLHLWVIGRPQSIALAFAPIPALECIAMGAVLAKMLASIGGVVRVKRPGGKLQVQVLQHYKELRALDMTHDQACEGAARFTAVPLDIARDWISKGAAALGGPDQQER